MLLVSGGNFVPGISSNVIKVIKLKIAANKKWRGFNDASKINAKESVSRYDYYYRNIYLASKNLLDICIKYEIKYFIFVPLSVSRKAAISLCL